MRTGEGYLLVFALDDERSFDKVFDNFWEQIVRIKVRKLSQRSTKVIHVQGEKSISGQFNSKV